MTATPFERRGLAPARRPPAQPTCDSYNRHQRFKTDSYNRHQRFKTDSYNRHQRFKTDSQPVDQTNPELVIATTTDPTTGNLIPECMTYDNSTSSCGGATRMAENNLAYPHFSFSTIETVTGGTYPYTDDLLKLAEITAPSANMASAPLEGFTTIQSPLVWSEWEKALHEHPDQHFRDYILDGIGEGFRVGFDPLQRLRSAKKNMQSALINPAPVAEYLRTELEAGRVLGPFQEQQASDIHTSSFGVIPKKHQPGKWRLILDLSRPSGKSVNDGIAKDLSSLRYASVDDAAHIVMQMGPNTRLAKIDIAHAYRNIPVHPDDRRLLGMRWENKVYIDTALPFGLRSAPKIFTAISDALEWILFSRGMSSCLHYLDDFVTMGAAGSQECKQNLELMLRTAKLLGLPIATHKVEGPTTVLEFLGIEFDTVNMVMRLPARKLEHLKQLVKQWVEKEEPVTKRELLSLIGELAHASKVVSPGRTFLRRMIDTAHSGLHLDRPIRLDKEFYSDLWWWHTFMERWNGVSVLAAHVFQPPTVMVYTDASGGWGCGATDGVNWLQCAWEESWTTINIATKELVPIILAVGTWGQKWKNVHVRFRSDNMAVVEVLKARTSRDPIMMHLLRCLHFLCAVHDVRISASHIAGVDNIEADALSRNNRNLFFVSSPKASRHPTPVTPQLWSLVVAERPDWLSGTWRSKLSAFSTLA